MSIPSLYSGLSGLSAHQRMLDVVGHNIANVNTRGFKTYNLRITENISSPIQPAIAPSADRGGVNPIQLGYGVNLGNVSLDLTQGNLEPTGRSLDLGIEGEGYFVLSDGASKYYSRVGNFAIDSAHYLVDQATGYRVQSSQGDIVIDQNIPGKPQPTAQISLQGNLDSASAIGTTVDTSIQVYDSYGQAHSISLRLEKTAEPPTNAPTWQLTASLPKGDGTISDAVVQGITFNEDGSFASVTGSGGGDNNIAITWDGTSTVQNISFNFGTADSYDGLTQMGGPNTAAASDQDGYEAAPLISLSIDPEGTIRGQYGNGEIRDIDELQLAMFSNPEGLEKTSNDLYRPSSNSGMPSFGKINGTINSGVLEASNVDLSKEIAMMIVAQRGFQVNARVITVSSQVLEEVTNLTR